MSPKKIIIIAICIIGLGIAGYVKRVAIVTAYNSIAYQEQIDFAQKSLPLFATGDVAKLKEVFVSDARFFKHPEYLGEVKGFFKGVNVNSINLGRAISSNENNTNVLFLDFYSEEGGERKNIRIKLSQEAGKWLLTSIMIG